MREFPVQYAGAHPFHAGAGAGHDCGPLHRGHPGPDGLDSLRLGAMKLALMMSGRRGPGGPSEGERGWGRHGGPFGRFPGGFPGGGFPGGGFPGGGPPFGRPPGGGWRSSKARRGDVRTAVLSVLADQPRNGYQVIQEIAERTDGAWKPSPGSVYPTLQQLEDEGLIRLEESDGKRLYHLTAAGEEYVASHADELAATWETVSDDTGGPPGEMIGAVGQLMGAVWQVTHIGDEAQRAQAREILERARRDLYRLLADGADETPGEASADSAGRPAAGADPTREADPGAHTS